MKGGNIYDVITTNEVISATDAAVHISSNVETNFLFYVLLTSVIAITYIQPQIYCAREFYRNCFRTRCWWSPPRRWLFDLVGFFTNILLIAAIVHYMWTRRDLDPTDSSALNYYAGIYALFIGYLGFRYFWINSFWNYHLKKMLVDEQGNRSYSPSASTSLGFAILFAFLMWAALTVLVILFGIQKDWAAMVPTLLVWIWSTLLAIWTVVVYQCAGKRCGSK